MKIKRYLARDMRAAFRMVREEQGPDAVILSSRRIGDQIEVVAALDYDAALVQQALRRGGDDAEAQTAAPAAATPTAPDTQAAPASNPAGGLDRAAATASASPAADDSARRPDVNPFTQAAESSPSAAAAQEPRLTEQAPRPAKADIIWAQDPHIERLERELLSLRNTIQSEMGQIARGAWEFRNLEHAHVAQQLERMGFEHALTAAAVRTLPADAVRPTATYSALRTIVSQMQALPADLLDSPGAIALVGPTGVGKTTTLAKLAARYVARYGTEGLALVTTDDFRIGAQEQLATYGRLLGVPVLTASGVEGLQQVLARLASKRMVLIDTAGMSPSDQQLATRLQQFGVDGGRVRTLLVLAATTQPEDQARAIHAFRPARPVGCVVTKLDESSRHGAVLSSVTRARLPVVYVADGQAVPEDLHRERPENLIKRAVQAARAHSTKTHDAQTSPGDYDREAANAVA